MKMRRRLLLLVIAGLFTAWMWSPTQPAAVAPVPASAAPPLAEPIPAPLPEPEAVSVDAAAQAGAELPRLYSLLVTYRGDLILERYYNGTRANRPTNIKSASKSVVSALVGIAIDGGVLEGVGQPIGSFFRDVLSGDVEAAKRDIKIEDLLTMRSGLRTTSNRYYGAWVLSSNWVRHALSRPLLRAPGTRMTYSTGNTHLLSAILTQATGSSTWQFAQDNLAKPLGFSLARWPRDPQGIYFGGNDMELTPKQMMAFGEMYLNRGRANGRQIVSEEWVRASLTRRTPSSRENGRFYGYGWWIREMAGYETNYAWGYGGQFIFIVPELELVVVTTSSINTGRSRRGHLRGVYDLVERHVIGPIDSARGATAAGNR